MAVVSAQQRPITLLETVTVTDVVDIGDISVTLTDNQVEVLTGFLNNSNLPVTVHVLSSGDFIVAPAWREDGGEPLLVG